MQKWDKSQAVIARNKLGLSQNDFACLLGVGVDTFVKLGTGTELYG